MLIFNISAIPSAMADDIPGGNYTFIDTCYSPELGMYAVVAKDMTNTNTPAYIFVSRNGEDWEKTRTVNNGLHSANKENRQTIVWWEAQHCFVTVMNNNLLTSADGYIWERLPSYERANSTVETNGRLLVISAGGTVRIFENLTDEPTVYNIDSGAYGKTIGVTPEEPYTYAVTDQWKTWELDAEGKVSSATPNLSATPVDMVYVSSFGGWIVINGTSILRVLAADSVKYTNFSSMRLSDGLTNDAKLTTAGAGENYVAVGTDTGKIYIAPNAHESLTIDTAWEIAQSGDAENVNTEPIRSISAVNDDMFLAVSQTKIFMVMQSENGWTYYDTSNSKMVLENARIEIPESGTVTEVLTPVHYDYRGEVSEDGITSFELQSPLPSGITSENISNSSVSLSVDSTVTGGHELTYRATTQNGKEQLFTVTIVDESYVEISGSEHMAVPLKGDAAERYEYTASIIGTDGKAMSRRAALSPVRMPDGVVFDSENNAFVIDSEAGDGSILLRAYSVFNPDNETLKEITVSLRRPERLEFLGGETSLYIPDLEGGMFEYPAMLYDQTDNEMTREKIIWSVEAKDDGSLDGISIDKDTGTLSVNSGAKSGTVIITAASENYGDVTAQKEVELLYTDLRKAKEDLSEFKIDTSQTVTDNLALITTGAFGSAITWRSTDETLIKPDGTVTRPSREDKKVTITGVSKNNSSSTEVKYELTVKKADNLCVNGDFADGTTNGWFPINETTLEITEGNGKNVLISDGEGAYQTLTFTNDSSYAFEAGVKAKPGSKIELVSKTAGTLAEITAGGVYSDIKTSYDYRKQKNTFQDEIYLKCSGEMTVSYLKIYEITVELNEAAAAVNKAVYSRSQADVNKARTLLNDFYDLPVRDELSNKMDTVKVQTNTASSGGSGGGGGGGSGGVTAQKKNNTVPSDVSEHEESGVIPMPGKQEDNYEDMLDTYLLQFKDMKNHWAREDVEYMGEKEIITGYEDGSFLPDESISRAEFAVLITRVIGLEETPYENSFFDVVTEDWYSGYVQTVRSNNFMNGYDGLFNPNAPISREEIARVIVSAYNSRTNTKLEMGKAMYFNDLDDISSWAYDYLAEAVNLGFVYGVTEEMLKPKDIATRAQAAVMLRRVYDKLNEA